eukprot:1157043-Pelagomonas_calceolata.AAC.2
MSETLTPLLGVGNGPHLGSPRGSARTERNVTTEHSGSKHQFTYDAVFGEGGQEASLLYPKCVSALVEGLFRGYNATVFACECCAPNVLSSQKCCTRMHHLGM